MLAKIWRWLKKLWQQLLGKPPQPSPRSAGTPGGKPNPRLSDAELESLFLQLLDIVEESASRGYIKGFLIAKNIKENELVAWLRRFGSKLLESPETHRKLGRRMVQLGKVAGGELGDVAAEIGRELLGNSETQTSIIATSVIPTVDKQTDETKNMDSNNIPLKQEAVDWYNRGFKEYNSGNLNGAIACFRLAIAISSEYDYAWSGLGTALIDLGQYQEAMIAYKRTLEISPNFYYAWNGLGATLSKLGQYKEAIAACNRAIEISPNFHMAWNNLGNVLSELGQYQQAVNAYQRALEISPNFHMAWNNLGYALSELGQYQQAVNAYQRALEIFPHDHFAWNNLGIALKNIGQYQQAIYAYQRAIEISPNDHYAWNGLGNVLQDVGEYQQAIYAYQRAIEILPNYHIAWYGLGNVLQDVGQGQEAIASYKHAIEISPNDHYAWNGLGNVLQKLGEYKQAIEAYQRAIEILPNYHAWYGLGTTLSELGRYQEAITSYKHAIEISPNEHIIWNGLGNALQKLGEYQQAIEAYQRALALSPNFHDAWNGLGTMLRALSQYEQAIEAYNRALEITQNQFWRAWANRGWAIYYLHGYQAALRNWDEGLQSLQPETPDYQEGCAILHQWKGYLHYDYGKQQPNPHPYWRESRNSYITALKTLSGSQTSILGEVLGAQVSPRFQLIYLEILQDLAKVCNALNYQDDSQLCLDIGDTMLENLIGETDSQERKIQLANKFATFSQLRVVLLAQSSQPKEALLLAEKRKNLCLRWLRESRYVGMKDETPLQYPEIEQFLGSSMAAIYWHYSPAAITTFIIKHDGIEIHSPENTAVKQLQEFEDWLKAWKKDYQNNRKVAKGAKEEKESWREKMADRLDELGKILDVEGILNKIGDDITDLILIPHRDLHLLPLHYLLREKDFTITYLPSLKVGIDLSVPPSPVTKLLSIENPQDLLFALVESSAIARLFPECDRIPSPNATISVVKTSLKNASGCFHFTGHAYHDPNYPRNSALILASEPNLTLADIFAFNTLNLQLVCLAACETGITGKEGLIDEFVGLASGFLATGVSYVVSSLWRVEERSTALLMMQFYHYIIDEKILPAIALNKAQNWLRQLTYGELAEWYLQLAPQFTEKCDRRLQPFLQRSAQQLLNSAKINLCDRPYENPYYWAGFIVNGAF